MKHIKLLEEFTDKTPLKEAMSLKDYYRNPDMSEFIRNSDNRVKDIAKQIDAIIDKDDLTPSSKDKLLDLMTDLTAAYLSDMLDEE